MAHYPADTFQEATEIAIEASNQLHQIINGDATTEIIVEDGSKIPSVRKSQSDSMYFKSPIDWVVGEYETDYLQLRVFTDGTWWFTSSATNTTKTLMSTTPYGDINWRLYSSTVIWNYKIPSTTTIVITPIPLYDPQIFIDGILQTPQLSYTINSNIITFSEEVVTDSRIQVCYKVEQRNSATSQVSPSLHYWSFTTTSLTTQIDTGITEAENSILFVNGVAQTEGINYTLQAGVINLISEVPINTQLLLLY